jgi:hypothetical protein
MGLFFFEKRVAAGGLHYDYDDDYGKDYILCAGLEYLVDMKKE